MFEKINTESNKNTQSLFFGCCPTQIYHHSIQRWVLNNQMKIDGLYHFYEAKDHLSHEKIIKLLNINRFICQLTVLFRQKKMKWRIICSWQSSEIFNNTSINYNYKFTWYILSESTCTVSYQWPVLTPVPIRDINISCRTCLSIVVK